MSHTQIFLEPRTRQLYVDVLNLLNESGIPYLVGGAYALQGMRKPTTVDPTGTNQPVTVGQDDAAQRQKNEAAARAKAQAEAEAKLRAQIEESRRAEQEARLRAEFEATRRAEAEARAKAEAEARAKLELEARLKAEADKREADAEAKAKADAEIKAKADAEAKAEAERRRAEDAKKRAEDAQREAARARPPVQQQQQQQQQATLPGNDADMTRLFLGKTNYWEPTRDGKSLQITFQPGGRMTLLKIDANRPNLQPFVGRWRVQGNERLCMAFPGGGINATGEEFCARIQRIGNEFAVLTGRAGFRARFKY